MPDAEKQEFPASVTSEAFASLRQELKARQRRANLILLSLVGLLAAIGTVVATLLWPESSGYANDRYLELVKWTIGCLVTIFLGVTALSIYRSNEAAKEERERFDSARREAEQQYQRNLDISTRAFDLLREDFERRTASVKQIEDSIAGFEQRMAELRAGINMSASEVQTSRTRLNEITIKLQGFEAWIDKTVLDSIVDDWLQFSIAYNKKFLLIAISRLDILRETETVRSYIVPSALEQALRELRSWYETERAVALVGWEPTEISALTQSYVVVREILDAHGLLTRNATLLKNWADVLMILRDEENNPIFILESNE